MLFPLLGISSDQYERKLKTFCKQNRSLQHAHFFAASFLEDNAWLISLSL